MAAGDFTPYGIIAKAFSRFIPRNILQYEDPNLYNINKKAKEKNAEVPYPMDKYGTNLGENPENYLGYLGKVIFKDTGLDQGRTYLSDGRTEINKEIAYPMGTLVHEAQHARDINSKYKANDYSKDSNRDELYLQDKLIGESISKKFNKLATIKQYEDPYLFKAYTKQIEPDEVVAQLKQYESLLPAGMTIFQSPLGKDLFNNDNAKRWWLVNTTDSMSSPNLQK
ncbi:hypothetical protein UFOVP22_50 [uncultured Caudovirales phage]|uniref:Uncharacterized protein n=1 Tax=uncultured Caudovirales phage TaxID=2100421 RepID=A0A6J5T868_9CAUD|nr:hypothetical protein UFOVP22_50 [uncultured Caudovirales phage]